jgi:glucose/arabinose dehydrogenase
MITATCRRVLRAATFAMAAVLAPLAGEAQVSIGLAPLVTTGLERPIYVTTANDGSGRLFIVEQPGRIRVLAAGVLQARPFLDLTAKVLDGGERGLLGLAFHPRFATNRRFFVNYTREPDGATVVSEFRASADGRVGLPAERRLFAVAQPFANHNGGMLAFGPGGGLYVAMGDGGGGGDPLGLAQNRGSLLGKILRIGVDGALPYTVPPTNPFARGGGRREIFALGFRNPWRFSFDRLTGQLYVADVGQDQAEEISIVGLGGNYGWPRFEGNSCYQTVTGCDPTGLRQPIAAYDHSENRCSITGGYVYRGRAVPALYGIYVFADFCTGEIFGLQNGQITRLLQTDLTIVSFGESRSGELHVVDFGGTIRQIVAGPPAP